MRALIILGIGLVFWGVCLGIGKLLGATMKNATLSFAGLWFFAVALNLWVAVFQSGYLFQEEAPIFLFIYLLPVAFAFFIQRKMYKRG